MTKQGITKHNDVNIVNFQVLLHSCTTLTRAGLEMKCANRIIVVPIYCYLY